jgi:sulfur carrier protein ThiS
VYLLEEEYELLARYIEGMISEGVLLIVGNTQLFEWSDTKIPDLLAEIRKKKDAIKALSFKVGDVLIDRHTEQEVVVIAINEDTVELEQKEGTFDFPTEKLWYYYKNKNVQTDAL